MTKRQRGDKYFPSDQGGVCVHTSREEVLSIFLSEATEGRRKGSVHSLKEKVFRDLWEGVRGNRS